MKRVLVMLVAAAMAASCTGKKQAETTASDEKVLTKTVPAALRVIEQNEVYTSEIELTRRTILRLRLRACISTGFWSTWVRA